MRLYFTSDLHGSTKCWKKLLATPGFYGADVLIVGGDIAGKFFIPVITDAGGGRALATYLGMRRELQGQSEIAALIAEIADAGGYGFTVTREEYEELTREPQRVDELQLRLMCERLEEWVALARDRLPPGTPCLVSPGNDDPRELDPVLQNAGALETPDQRVVELDGHELIGLGVANETPWNCPRDMPEEQIAARLQDLASRLSRPEQAIFDVHVPPLDSGLDLAPKLDGELRPLAGAGGQPELVGVGSSAVRDALLEIQPLLGLHGHIHECRAVQRLGRTTVVNPGSEYGEGILCGAIIDLDRRRGLRSVQLVTG